MPITYFFVCENSSLDFVARAGISCTSKNWESNTVFANSFPIFNLLHSLLQIILQLMLWKIWNISWKHISIKLHMICYFRNNFDSLFFFSVEPFASVYLSDAGYATRKKSQFFEVNSYAILCGGSLRPITTQFTCNKKNMKNNFVV